VAGDAARQSGAMTSATGDLLEPVRHPVTSPATALASTKDGYFWFMGRVDDVMNVAGHRISTAEVESASWTHPAVGRGCGRGQERPRDRAGDLRVRHAAAGYEGRPSSSPSCATTSPSSSARSQSRNGSRSRQICPKLEVERSCAACSVTSRERKLGDTTTLADSSIVADLQRRATEEEAKEQ